MKHLRVFGVHVMLQAGGIKRQAERPCTGRLGSGWNQLDAVSWSMACEARQGHETSRWLIAGCMARRIVILYS